MSRKIARITQDKKLLLANEIVESNAKTSLNSDGRLDTDEIIEYPAELEGGRNLIKNSKERYKPVNPAYIVIHSGLIEDGKYTLSFKYEIEEENEIVDNFPVYIGRSVAKADVANKPIGKTSVTFSISKNDLNKPIYLYIGTNAQVSIPNSGWFRELKLEKGDIATPWTPAPEDLGLNYPDSIQNFNSSISGNNIIAPEFIEGYPFVKPVIDDSLVLWLDGTTGNNYEQTKTWKDLSGNGNDGQLMNFNFTEDSGWVDGGLRFDGVDDYVYCGNGESLNITDDLTIEMLVYIPEDGKFGGVVKGRDGTWVSNSYGLRGFYGDCWFYITDGNNRSYINIVIPKGELVHIVGTTSKASNIMKCYRNGRLVSSRERGIEDIQVQQDGLYVGVGYTTYLTKGNIFLVRIYNRALTDEEILQNYQAGQCSPLLAMRGDV